METPKSFERAVLLGNGVVQRPKCHGVSMKYYGECSASCCDYFVCSDCGYRIRIEYPD